MNKSLFSWELYHKSPIIAIICGIKMDKVHEIARTCLEAGFYTIEKTMNTNDVIGIIASLRKKFSGLNVGAGTVCSLLDYRMAVDAGA